MSWLIVSETENFREKSFKTYVESRDRQGFFNVKSRYVECTICRMIKSNFRILQSRYSTIALPKIKDKHLLYTLHYVVHNPYQCVSNWCCVYIYLPHSCAQFFRRSMHSKFCDLTIIFERDNFVAYGKNDNNFIRKLSAWNPLYLIPKYFVMKYEK